jgi:hypothetical protein
VEVNRTSSTDETTSSPSIVKDLSSAAELPATSGLDPTPAPAARHGSGIDEDEEETAVSSTGGGLMGWVALVAAAGLAGFVVFFVGAVVVAGVSLFLFGGESTVPDGVPTETVAAPNPAPVAEPVHAVQPGEGAHFVSDLPGTRKVSVRCDGGKSDGGSEASVEGTALGTCTVTAVDSKRNRQTAVVSNTELRTYRCFGGQGAGCE